VLPPTLLVATTRTAVMLPCPLADMLVGYALGGGAGGAGGGLKGTGELHVPPPRV